MATKNKYDWQSTWWDSLERPAEDKSKETVSNFLSGVGNFITNTFGNTFNKSQQQQAASRQPSANAHTIAQQASGEHLWTAPTPPASVTEGGRISPAGNSTLIGYDEDRKLVNSGNTGGNAVTSYSGAGYSAYPAYVSPYESQLQAALNKLINREEFNYDYLSDPLYQQYAKQYGIQGDLARQDTLGDVASMTGGMPSSYAVTAAQQAQNGWNNALNDMIPALHDAAYRRYMGDYEADANLASMLSSLDSMAYDRYNRDRNYNLALQEANNRARRTVTTTGGGYSGNGAALSSMLGSGMDGTDWVAANGGNLTDEQLDFLLKYLNNNASGGLLG